MFSSYDSENSLQNGLDQELNCRSSPTESFGTTPAAEEFPGEHFAECEKCGASFIVNRRCEACFEPMDCFTCHSCDVEILLPDPGDSKGRMKSCVLLAVREFLPNNSLQTDRYSDS